MSTRAHSPLGLNLDMQDVSFQFTSSNLNTSRKYALILGAKQPAYCEGLQKPKSEYVALKDSKIMWRKPFGARLTIICTTPEARLVITLREHHKVRASRNTVLLRPRVQSRVTAGRELRRRRKSCLTALGCLFGAKGGRSYL